jgi:hypothetical protein
MCFCIQKAGTPVVSAGATSQKVGSLVLLHTAKKEESSPRKLPSTGWHSIIERRGGGVLVGNNHVIWLKEELFIGNMDRATDPFLVTSALLLRHSRHFGHNIEQFHLMAATREPKMPVVGLKEGRKECDPNEECWSSNFVNGRGPSFSFAFLMRRCWARPTRPPPPTHTYFG